MTDKELLERAAKAAGVEGYRYSDGFRCMAHWNESDGGWFDACCLWDPLHNDGDALRLAVKLKMDLLQYADEDSVPQHACVNYTTCEDYGDDPYAATRRSIVRAAAQLA